MPQRGRATAILKHWKIFYLEEGVSCLWKTRVSIIIRKMYEQPKLTKIELVSQVDTTFPITKEIQARTA